MVKWLLTWVLFCSLQHLNPEKYAGLTGLRQIGALRFAAGKLCSCTLLSAAVASICSWGFLPALELCAAIKNTSCCVLSAVERALTLCVSVSFLQS